MLPKNLPLSVALLPLLLSVGPIPLSAQNSASSHPPTPEAPNLPAIKPNPFLVAHEAFLKIAKEGKAELLFLGDSITAGWAGHPEIWNKAFSAYKPANFGIGGDRTQHVLWRIQNGELDSFAPKVLVLMIGTNNSGVDSAEGIAGGIQTIVATIREKSPTTKILILGVFPRGETPSPTREKLATVNASIAKLDNRKSIFYLDIGRHFLNPDGSISKEIMPDFLHLSSKGYQIWADAISPTLADLFKPANPAPNPAPPGAAPSAPAVP
jgi:lysophospholipase L1-like esterase